MSRFRNEKKIFFDSKSVWSLATKILLLLVIPYVYLLICGLVFDMLLQWYFMTGFIFYSLIALYLAAIVLIVILTVRFIKSRKKGE